MNPFQLVNSMHAAAMVEASEKTWTLGRIIERLEQLPVGSHMQFAFGSLRPTTLKSWRGVYSQLALGYEEPRGVSQTVGSLLEVCRAADGSIFTGYKGGDYVMGRHTPVWISNYGNSDHTAILDIRAISEGWVYIYAMDLEYIRGDRA